MIFVSPNTLTFWHTIFFLFLIVVAYIFITNIKYLQQVYCSREYYFFFWIILILLFIKTIAFISPMFSFMFVTTNSCILLFIALPLNFFKTTQSFVLYQQNFLRQLLYFMSKTQLLAFFSIIYIKYFFVNNIVLFSTINYIVHFEYINYIF